MAKMKTTAQMPVRENWEDPLKPDYWRNLAPSLTIGGKACDNAFPVSPEQVKDLMKGFATEGYIHLQSPGLKSPMTDIAALFTTLVGEKMHPVMAFVYDEVWALGAQLRNMLAGVLDRNFHMMPRFWAWRIAPGQAGWKPHRDMQGGSLFSDRTPKTLTVWLPVTRAHPLNGCMYILPANFDDMYDMDGVLGYNADLVNFRALPAEPGDVLAWTQRVMHWGSHSADNPKMEPRMSIAFEFQRSDIDPLDPVLLDAHNPPAFERRLALIAKQIKQYDHMYGFDPRLVSFSDTIIERYGKL